MKSLILAIFVSTLAFGALIESKESFRNNAYAGGEFSEFSEKSESSENSKNLENSSGEILVRKYKKWEDLENEWEEKWDRDEKRIPMH